MGYERPWGESRSLHAVSFQVYTSRMDRRLALVHRNGPGFRRTGFGCRPGSRDVRIVTVVGARPQFVKAATVRRALDAANAAPADRAIEEIIVHTGQHYDANMSRVFFDELGIP